MKHTPSPKALIVIPYWDGDRTAALGLSHLLADIQPQHSEFFDLLFVSRYDAAPVDKATINHCARKFNVFTYKSARREEGWPRGCNAVMTGSLEWSYRMISTGRVPTYKFLFNCASDSIPLTPDALAYLHRSWDVLNQKKSIVMAGALVPDGGRDHINGDCCLLSGELPFLKWLVLALGGLRVKVGWDYGFASDFQKRGWSNLDGIRSLWNTPTMSDNDAAAHAKRGVAWIHGVKDASLLRWSRANVV